MFKIPHRSIFALLALPFLAIGLSAFVYSSDISYPKLKKAPQWEITEWFNKDVGGLDKLKGKVVVIDFFQLWCPGCNKFSGPLMDHWQHKFADEIKAGQLELVKIHTVFEGHSYQNKSRLKRYIKKKGITLPIGIDRHRNGKHVPVTMDRYQTRGTPEIVVIDKNGMIQFQQFGYFEASEVEKLIAQLMKNS